MAEAHTDRARFETLTPERCDQLIRAARQRAAYRVARIKLSVMEHNNTTTAEQARVLLAPVMSQLQNAFPGASHHSVTVAYWGDNKVFFGVGIAVGKEHLASTYCDTPAEAIEHLSTRSADELRERAAKLVAQAEALEGGAL